MKTVAFFNNKGGVGKTSLVHHLAWMYARLGTRVLAADLDPQANLSAMFLREDRLAEIWPDGEHPETFLGAVAPIQRGLGDIRAPVVHSIADGLGLVAGDLGLSRFEAKLSTAWSACMDGDPAAFRMESAFHRILLQAASSMNAELVLVDVGPNLGAINRAALIAANHVVFPLAPDLFSIQGLRNLGPTLRDWRREWGDRLQRRPADEDFPLPTGVIAPAGYVVMQHAVRRDRPVKASMEWIRRVPLVYREEVLGEREVCDERIQVESDPHCLGTLRHYRSLMPLAQDARKPMFELTPADGALGGHAAAVRECRADFERLARRIGAAIGASVGAEID